MEILLLIILVVLGISLFPHIRNWKYKNHCPNCGKWFCLNLDNFVVTDKVVGYNRRNSGWGYLSGLFKGGFLFGSGRTRDDPFIREWGEEHYTCRVCRGSVTLYNVKRDK